MHNECGQEYGGNLKSRRTKMAKKKEVSEEVKLLKSKVQDNKAVIGLETVLKQLKCGALSQVFLASNCPAKTKEDILHYANMVKVSIVELKLNNEELGILCKKNFFISVMGIVE